MKEIVVTVKSASIVVPDLSRNIKNENLNTPVCDIKNPSGLKQNCTTDAENMVYFNHVSNLLHVLMGCRPVPSKKATLRHRNTIIDDITEMSLIRDINVNKITSVTKKGDEKTYTYISYTQGKKPWFNSNAKYKTKTIDGLFYDGVITWDSLYKKSFFNNKAENMLISLKEIGKNLGIQNVEQDYSLIDFLYEIRNYKEYADKIIADAEKYEMSTIKHIVNNDGEFKSGGFTDSKSKNLAALVNNVSQTPKITSNFDIIFYVNDEICDIINKGPKVATFLDGGVAYISAINTVFDDCINDVIEERLENRFTKVSQLKKM